MQPVGELLQSPFSLGEEPRCSRNLKIYLCKYTVSETQVMKLEASRQASEIQDNSLIFDLVAHSVVPSPLWKLVPAELPASPPSLHVGPRQQLQDGG